MADARIVLNLLGGVVRDIFSSNREVEITVVDWNTEGCEADAIETVEVRCGDGKRRRAIVTCRAPYRLKDLAGTDVAAALQEAGVGIDTSKRATQDDSGVFALYDLDRGELVTTEVFCSYREAADEIDPRMTDVQVVRILPD